MKIFYRGRDDQFDAQGKLVDGTYTVLKGSRISTTMDKGLCDAVKTYRSETGLISNNILLRDITFSSASAAAQFVSGHSTNGLRAWKDSDGNAIGKTITGQPRKKRKI